MRWRARVRVERAGRAPAWVNPLAQIGTAILAVTVTGHRLEACATFRNLEKRSCRHFGGKRPGQPPDIPRAQNEDWDALTGLAAVFMSPPGALP
jgi:hypothetical protein